MYANEVHNNFRCSNIFTTGKTSTVVEAILQICRSSPSMRILACAPSDAAADVLCERLSLHLDRSKLFRLNWWQRVSASVPTNLRRFCYEVNNMFEIPPVSDMCRFQVIVSNCGTAGILKTLSPYILGFDVLFVDEASQAMEPEVHNYYLVYFSFMDFYSAFLRVWRLDNFHRKYIGFYRFWYLWSCVSQEG